MGTAWHGVLRVAQVPGAVELVQAGGGEVYQYKPGLFAHWQLIAFT